MKTNVAKEWLIETLKHNRAGHRAEFEKAWKKFEEKAIRSMQRNLGYAHEGKGIQLYIALTQPKDETAAYDRVLGMLEHSESETIELSEADWQKYVQDQWEWTNAFKTSTQAYLGQEDT